jgi:hypothetical protein
LCKKVIEFLSCPKMHVQELPSLHRGEAEAKGNAYYGKGVLAPSPIYVHILFSTTPSSDPTAVILHEILTYVIEQEGTNGWAKHELPVICNLMT